ncbi:MAG TPA: hypothetical protein VFJ72_07355 [Rubrobacteraceae bacterium]|nr:hypothetical protein [Rubrobacteraceae bacterium]
MLVRMRRPVGTLFESVWERFGSGGEAERMAHARALISSGEYAPALNILARLLNAAESSGKMPVVVEVLAVRALLLRDLSEHEDAMSAIARALSFGEREGYVNVFVREGAPMAALLYDFLRDQREGRIEDSPRVPPEYVGMLLAMLRVRAALPDEALV